MHTTLMIISKEKVHL